MSKYIPFLILIASGFTTPLYADNSNENVDACKIKHVGDDCNYTDQENTSKKGVCQQKEDKVICVAKIPQ